MSRIKKIMIRVCATLFGCLCLGVAMVESSYAVTNGGWIGVAEGDSVPVGSGGSGGGGCTNADNLYRVDCAGVSWIFYKSLNEDPEVARDINFPVPFVSSIAMKYDKAIIPRVCAEHTTQNGGFWHFGINAFLGADAILLNHENGESNDFGIAWGISSGDVGHWQTLNYGAYTKNISTWRNGLYKSNIGANQTIEGLYEAAPYKESDVVEDYQKAWKGANPGYKEDEVPSEIPGDVYAFCYWDGMDSNYYSKSYASNRRVKLSTGDPSDYIDTGIVDRQTSKTTSPQPRSVGVGDEVNITFTHNVYATTENSDIKWKVRRTMNDGSFVNEDKYTITPNSEAGVSSGGLSEYTEEAIAKTSAEEKSGNYYIGGERTYTDGAEKYILRDYYTIKFKAVGKYKFCESVILGDAVDYNTQVCTEIEVVDSALYYGFSNVRVTGSNGEEAFETTLIAQNKLAPTASITIKKGDSASIIFSHDAYSSMEINENVGWSVERKGNFSQVGSSNGTAKTGANEFTRLYLNYYTPENDVKKYSDGTYKYLFRETFNNRVFNKVGSYSFCETMYVNTNSGEMGGAKVYTMVCAIVKVIDDDPPPSDYECKVWAPKSYNNSTRFSGTTSVLSAVKNNGLMTDFEKALDESGSNASIKIYARPGDEIQWRNCYYAGVQKLANDRLVGLNGSSTVSGKTSHGTHTSCSCTSNTYESFRNLITWEKEFRVSSTTDAYRNGIFKLPNKFETQVNGETATGGYDLKTKNNSFPTYGKYIYEVRMGSSIGVGDIKATSNNYKIKATNDVGHVYSEEISTNGKPYWAKYWTESHTVTACCPNCCKDSWCCCNPTHDHCSSYSAGSSKSGNLSAKTTVSIPYNFINTTAVSLKGINASGQEVAYASEKIEVKSVSVTVGQKKNDVVYGKTYATQVDNARTVLVAYVSSTDETSSSSMEYGLFGREVDLCSVGTNWAERKQCMLVQNDGVVLNYDSNAADVLEGGTEFNKFKKLKSESNETDYTPDYHGNYNVFDASAGDYMCFAMAVYPATSGVDDNLNPSGDNKWAISKSCIVIAKKPSIQVLGGDLFTGGGISTNVSEKGHLYGNIEGRSYTGQGSYSPVVNGSWVEEGIIASGLVTEMSSGASLGYSDKGWGIGALGATDFCKSRVPLSFANYSGSDLNVGGIICPSVNAIGRIADSGNLGFSNASTNRKALADYWGDGSMEGVYAGYNLGNEVGRVVLSATGKDIRIVEQNGGEIRIGRSIIYNDMLRVVKAVDGVVTIGDDIVYSDSSVSNAGSLPKVVIYGRNIDIECNVERIDAILIAEDTINTCSVANGVPRGRSISRSVSGEVNARGYSVQLVVNGALIANKINAPRTYGNSVGAGSGNAAEIINYDTSAMIWSRYMAGTSESDTMTVTYMRELAPRY